MGQSAFVSLSIICCRFFLTSWNDVHSGHSPMNCTLLEYLGKVEQLVGLLKV